MAHNWLTNFMKRNHCTAAKITKMNNYNNLNKKVLNQNVFDTREHRSIEVASELMHTGKVIALPTDTVYGLACSANCHTAIQRLYEIKGRDESKPVAICVAELTDIKHWGVADHLSMKLLEKLLPGAVTIVVNKSKWLNNPFLNPGTNKIGMRIPDFNFIRDVSKKFEYPIALTSANRSSEKSSLNINEFAKLWPQLGAVFDGGQLGLNEEQRAASTVIDLSVEGNFQVIREGVAIHHVLDVMKQFNIVEL